MLKKILSNRIVIFLSLAVYWTGIAVATSLPSSSLPKTSISDKYQHFLAYLGLGILLSLTLRLQDKFPLLKKKPVLFTLIIAVVYAALDEIHQMFIPGRYGDVLDFAADSLGALTGVFIAYFLIKKYLLTSEND